MKTTLLLTVLLSCCLSQAQALTNEQNNPKYFPTTTSWTQSITNQFDESYCKIIHYRIGNDTIIKEQSYKRVYQNDDLCAFALRESNEKIFLYLYEAKQEIQAYDFDWQVGKEIYYQNAEEPYDHIRSTITAIKKTQLVDMSYQEYIDYSDDCKIIKGIGSEQGVFTFLFPQPTNGDRIDLLCFSRNDALIYKNPKFVDCESCERNGVQISEEILNLPYRYVNNKFYFSTEKYIDIKLILYDVNGREFFSKNLKGNDLLNLDFLMNGIYFYQITLNGNSYTGNFIIKN